MTELNEIADLIEQKGYYLDLYSGTEIIAKKQPSIELVQQSGSVFQALNDLLKEYHSLAVHWFSKNGTSFKVRGSSFYPKEEEPALNGTETGTNKSTNMNTTTGSGEFYAWQNKELEKTIGKLEKQIEKLDDENERLKTRNYDLERENAKKDDQNALTLERTLMQQKSGLDGLLEKPELIDLVKSLAESFINRNNGQAALPAPGLFGDVTDPEIRQTLEYIISNLKAKDKSTIAMIAYVFQACLNNPTFLETAYRKSQQNGMSVNSSTSNDLQNVAV
jgi:hypothetical protein